MTVSERIFRADAAVECEKLMSLHVYYHAAGIHREEIERYWTRSNECTWAHNFGQMGDKANFTLNYAGSQEADAARAFESAAAVYPELRDPELVADHRAILEQAMHFTVSPIVEVAGDGQTAKGLFYTPGMITSTLNPQQALEGTWIWERYGADFVYEDGRWVYKNLKVCCDLVGEMDAPNWPVAGLDATAPPEDEEPESGQPMEITHPGPLHYSVSPTQLPQERPFMPLPYRTFTDTYNYAALTGIYEENQ